jgi:hypothetical protein
LFVKEKKREKQRATAEQALPRKKARKKGLKNAEGSCRALLRRPRRGGLRALLQAAAHARSAFFFFLFCF